MMVGSLQLALLLSFTMAAAKVTKVNTKRILLHSDQDIIQKVLSLEVKVNSQQAVINSQQSTIQSLNASVNSQQGTIQSLNASVNTQQGTIQSLNASVNSQLTTIQALNSTANVQKTIIQTLTSSFNRLEGNLNAVSSSVGGSVYIRWGRKVCPGNNTELIYRGYMAGKYYNKKGGGTNTQCLPEDPTWANFVDGEQTGWRSYIYAGEVDTGPPFDKPFGFKVHDEDLPCAVCRSPRVSSLMIPARVGCYPGWSLEYTGYLFASHDTFYAADYLCVDSKPEFVTGGVASSDEHLVYATETTCSTLPCPPYVDGRELACVVCSK